MLSVVIPTLDAEEGLARTLAALVPAAAEGVVREVIVGDGGSSDGTEVVADAAGCGFVTAGPDWGARLIAAAREARRAPWLMILEPAVVPEPGWFREVGGFVERAERSGRTEAVAGVFRLSVDADGTGARAREWWASLSTALLRRPTPAQGLVLSRRAFDRATAGGPPASPADLLARAGRPRLHALRARAILIG